MSEPKRITAGNSYSWEKSLADFPPADGWTLHYSLVNAVNKYQFDAADDGQTYSIAIGVDVSKDFVAGEYKLIGYVAKAGERKTVFSERLIVRPDFSDLADFRSYAEKVLEAINATIAKTATKDQQSITVDGQTLARRSIADLLLLKRHFAREVARERQAAKIKKAGGLAGRVSTRLK